MPSLQLALGGERWKFRVSDGIRWWSGVRFAMKGLKIFGFVVGGIAVLCGLVLALALTSGVQTWAVRKAVAGQPGMTLEVAKVDAGFSAAEITDLRLTKDGMVVTAKSITAKYSAWDYLTQKRINADSVAVQDLLVDLRNAKPAAAAPGSPGAAPAAPGKATPSATTASAPKSPAAQSAPFNGLLQEAQLPFDLRVASLLAQGRALLSTTQTATFELKGDNQQTGQRGKLEWTVDFADATPDAPIRALRTTGTAGVQLANDRRIDVVEIDAIAAAMGPKLPADRIKLTAKADQPTPGGNEGYTAQLGLMRGTTVEPLLKLNAQYITAAREITGAWEIAVRSEQLAALLTGLGLPEVAANGAGRFALKPDTKSVSASGDLQAQISQLQKLSPALEAIGAVQVKTTFDGGLAGDVARLDKLNLEVTGAVGRKFAEVTIAQKVTYGLVDKKVVLADPKAPVARISLQQLPLAWAQPALQPMTIESGDLSLVLEVEADADGSRIRVRAAEPLLARSVTIRDAQKKALVEKLTLSLRPTIDYTATRVLAQLAELSLSMPAGDTITGTISAEITELATKPVIAFAAQLQTRVIAALKPFLAIDTGPLTATLATEGRMTGDTLVIQKSTSRVTRESGALLTSYELVQPLTLNLKTTTFTVPNPTATAARLKLGEVPLAWGEAFIAKAKLGGALTGGAFDVSLRSLEDLTVSTTEPLTLRAVSATLDGKAMAQALDITANLSATKKGDAVTYDVRRLELKQGEAALATLIVAGEAKLGTKLTIVAKGTLDADVAALMKQPAAAAFATLSRGRLTAVFDANIADAIQAKAAISAKNLVAKQGNRTLGDLDLTLDATMKTDGSGTLTLPITLTSAQRKSDVSIVGAFGKAANKETFLFTGKIASNNLVVEDFEPLAGLAPSEKPKSLASAAGTPPTSRTGQPIIVRAPGPTPAPTSTPPAGRDTAPFWKAVNGKVEMDLKRILYGKDYVISAVQGTTVITDSKLSLDGLTGKFKENPFKLAGGMTFVASQPKPYALTASADVQNLDIGEILRAANPEEKPVFETKASLVARLNGNGGTVGDLFKNAFGKFELTGAKGVTRLLAKRGGASTAVNVVSGALAIAGIFQKNERSAQALGAGAELIRLLNEVHFDTAKVVVERNPDLSFKITSLEILSPILRASGTGTLASKSVDDAANAPMNIQLQLGAKNEFAYALQRTGLLSGTADAQGYHQLSKTFSIGGTPSKVDNNSVWAVLGQLGLDAFLNR